MTILMEAEPGRRLMATDDALRRRVALDWASLASRAGLELDDLHRGRDIDPVAIRRLVEAIGREFPSGLDANGPGHSKPRFRAIMVMKRAISDSQDSSTRKANADVLVETSTIVDTLSRIAQTPIAASWSGNEELLRMRSFCLALSRRASAARAMREEE